MIMKLPAIFSLVCVLLFLLNVPRVESSRPEPQGSGAGHHAPGQGHHRDHDGNGGNQYDQPRQFSFYVFGDSFADTGNLLKQYRNCELSRQWYPPYQATGRFSNVMVQSDFVANMIGQSSSPPAHRQTRQVGPAGMNFAVGGSGVFDVPDTQTLRRQVHTFGKLVKDGDIKKEGLGQSVALVAVSGNDYAHVASESSGYTDIMTLAQNVTAEIVANVARLQDLGVQKVLVNNLFPIGCAPSRSRPSYYARCDEWANQVAAIHNRQLADKLAGMEGVLLLDLSAAFSKIVGRRPDRDMTNLFPNKLVPCCISDDDKGYCGQVDPETDEPRYTVCKNPNSYFFWDKMNPTQVGWEAVMGQLQRPIRDFLQL